MLAPLAHAHQPPVAHRLANGYSPTMTQPTARLDEANPRLLLIEERLGEPLADYLTAQRAAGVAWRRIAIGVTERTGIDITGEWLRVWHVGLGAEDAA